MKAGRRVFTGVMLFVAGALVGHFEWRGTVAPAPDTADSLREASLQSPEPAAAQAPSRPKAQAAARLATEPAAGASMAPESEAAGSKDFDELEADPQTSQLVQNPIAIQEPVTVTKNPDGSRDVFGKTADGRDAFRHFNPRDELTREGWSTPAGENFYRSYYDQGGVKQVSLNRPDHTSVSITLNQAGLYESRYEQLPDGTGVSTEYDDTGGVRERVRLNKDGNERRWRVIEPARRLSRATPRAPRARPESIASPAAAN